MTSSSRRERRGQTKELFEKLEHSGNGIVDMLEKKGLQTDPGKNKFFLSQRGKETPSEKIDIKGVEVASKPEVKYLAFVFGQELFFLPHTMGRADSATLSAANIARLSRATRGLSSKAISLGAKTLVLPSFEYGSKA